MQIYFLRHGQSEANAKRILAGGSESPLTKLGRLQASKEAKRLADRGQNFDVILTSPLSRALETAYSIADGLGYDRQRIVIDDRLKERSGGMTEGMEVDYVRGLSEPERIALGAESLQQLAVRVKGVLALIEDKYADKSVLLVSHHGVGRMLQALLRWDDPIRMHQIDRIPNAETMSIAADRPVDANV